MPSLIRNVLRKLAVVRKLAVAGVLTVACFGQGGSVTRQVVAPTVAQNGTGQPASYALVQVCPSTAIGFPCSPLVAHVYQDQALTEQLPAAFAADVNGNYQFFIGTGAYIVQETNAIGAGYSFQYSWLIFVNGTGTVSSVGLSVPTSIFAVTNSPVTTSGILSFGLITQPANSVFGNCTGSVVVPVFCSLTAAMIPATLNPTTINGNLTVNGNETISGTLGVTGAATFATIYPQAAQIGSGGLSVTGASSLSSLVLSSNAVIGGYLDITGAGIQLGGSFGGGGQILESTGFGTVFANLYYQTVKFGGTDLTQRPIINFNPLFTATDSAIPPQTNIALNAPGTGLLVATYNSTPGSSTSPAFFDGNGNLTPGTLSYNAPQRIALTVPVTLPLNTQTTIVTESVTFPSTPGTYRADSRYGLWIQAGPNACAAEVIDTTNSRAFALSGQDSNGSGYIGLTGSEVSTQTYTAGSTAIFTLQAICNAGGGATAEVNSGLFALIPAETSYLSVVPILSN